MNINSDLQLFVDNTIIQSKSPQITNKLHHPNPKGISIIFNQPWEGNISGYYTIIQEPSLLRLYYRGSQANVHQQSYTPYKVCYAESRDDGHTWHKPQFKIYPIPHHKRNNIIWWESKTTENFTPFLDNNPNALQSQKYKAIAGGVTKIYAICSADGMNWDWMQKEPILKRVGMKLDGQNIAFWHTSQNQYLLFHRNYHDLVTITGRDIMISTSPDFINWTPSQWLSLSNPLHQELYTNCIYPYPRAPQYLLGFPMRFHPTRNLGATKYHGTSDSLFISSRDGGKTWNKHPDGAWLRPGNNFSRWGTRNNMLAVGCFKNKHNELCFLANEGYYAQQCQLRLFTLRLDGFVSLHAGSDEGTFMTIPLIFTGKEMIINFATSALGWLKVEFLDENQKIIPTYSKKDCPEMYGDNIKYKVPLDMTLLNQKRIQIKFYMMECDLYSFMFV